MTQPQPQVTQDLTDLPNGGKHLVLPSGGWVEFANPQILRRGKYRKKIYGRVTDWDNQGVVGLEILEAIAAELITAWQIDEFPNAPLPKDDPGILGEQDGPDYDAILVYATNAQTVVFPGSGSAEAPTRPASA